MAISRVEDIISEVNSQTDAEKLAYLLDYHSEKVQITPTQVKCFCPLHHEQAFRSLILDVKGHSYRCTMKRCPGFEGGTFVHLWGVYRSMAPLEAALSLAEKLKLNIDVQALRLLGGNLIGKAKEATASGDLAAARAAIDQAVAFDPKSIEAARLSAEIWYKSGDRDRATEEYTRAIDLALEAKDFAAAHSVLGPLTASDPKSIEFAQRKVSLAKAESDPQAISESLLRLAELYGETGSVTSELAALDEVLAAAGQDARLLERVAEIHKKAERSAKRMEILDRLIPIYEGQGDWNKVLAALQVRLDHSPDDADLREKMAEALMRTGKTEAAAARILELAEHHRLTGTVIKAQSLIRKLVEAQPENTQALEKLAALSAEGGQRKDAVESYRKLAAVARKGGRMDEAARYLGRARAIDPDDHALRRDLAETQLSSNRVEEGISELFGLADVFLSESDPAEGFKILDRIAELAPDDAARHIEIGRCLEAAGYDEKAVEGFATFVKRVQKAGRHEDALAVCKEARRLAPRNEFFIEAAMESLMAAGRKTEAVTVLRDAARSLMEVENWRAAEAMLGRAAKIDRTDPGIKTDMAEILERAGRTEDAVRLWREVAQTHRAAENSEQTLIAARQMLRLDPANVEAKAMLAEALEATGETREALELWKESVATLLQRDANSGPALKVLEHILTLAPDDMMMIAQTAQLKFRVLGADKAKPAFDLWIEKARRTLDPKLLLLALQSSVEAYPKEIAWRSHLAELLIAREQSAEAIPHLESLLAAYKLLGKEDGDYRRILDQLVALCPDRLDLRVEWADALAKGGEVKRALEIFDEIARQYLARGDQEHGLQLLQRSLKYQPENREILLRAAELLERLNRRPEAIAAYEQLVDLSRRLDTWRSNVAAIDKLLMLCPDRHDLRLELAQAYESHGDIENAVDQYHRVAQALVKKDIKGNQTLEICERLVMIAPPEMRAARENNKMEEFVKALGYHNHSTANAEHLTAEHGDDHAPAEQHAEHAGVVNPH
ncbi:tetratricopeptide repeat protein [Candidatus Sumerlaeota bacterium]|nr:tetratricopeptide repeat protein [Candidatus Sumerlaeota bacterium]